MFCFSDAKLPTDALRSVNQEKVTADIFDRAAHLTSGFQAHPGTQANVNHSFPGFQPPANVTSGLSGFQPQANIISGLSGFQHQANVTSGLSGFQPQANIISGLSGFQPPANVTSGLSGFQHQANVSSGLSGFQHQANIGSGLSGFQPPANVSTGLSGFQSRASESPGLSAFQPLANISTGLSSFQPRMNISPGLSGYQSQANISSSLSGFQPHTNVNVVGYQPSGNMVHQIQHSVEDRTMQQSRSQSTGLIGQARASIPDSYNQQGAQPSSSYSHRVQQMKQGSMAGQVSQSNIHQMQGPTRQSKTPRYDNSTRGQNAAQCRQQPGQIPRPQLTRNPPSSTVSSNTDFMLFYGDESISQSAQNILNQYRNDISANISQTNEGMEQLRTMRGQHNMSVPQEVSEIRKEHQSYQQTQHVISNTQPAHMQYPRMPKPAHQQQPVTAQFHCPPIPSSHQPRKSVPLQTTGQAHRFSNPQSYANPPSQIQFPSRGGTALNPNRAHPTPYPVEPISNQRTNVGGTDVAFTPFVGNTIDPSATHSMVRISPPGSSAASNTERDRMVHWYTQQSAREQQPSSIVPCHSAPRHSKILTQMFQQPGIDNPPVPEKASLCVRSSKPFTLQPTICTEDVIEYKVADLLRFLPRFLKKQRDALASATTDTMNKEDQRTKEAGISVPNQNEQQQIRPASADHATGVEKETITSQESQESMPTQPIIAMPGLEPIFSNYDQAFLLDAGSLLDVNKRRLLDELTLGSGFGPQSVGADTSYNHVLRTSPISPPDNGPSYLDEVQEPENNTREVCDQRLKAESDHPIEPVVPAVIETPNVPTNQEETEILVPQESKANLHHDLEASTETLVTDELPVATTESNVPLQSLFTKEPDETSSLPESPDNDATQDASPPRVELDRDEFSIELQLDVLNEQKRKSPDTVMPEPPAKRVKKKPGPSRKGAKRGKVSK